jgi:hypothetical protein
MAESSRLISDDVPNDFGVAWAEAGDWRSAERRENALQLLGALAREEHSEGLQMRGNWNEGCKVGMGKEWLNRLLADHELIRDGCWRSMGLLPSLPATLLLMAFCC